MSKQQKKQESTDGKNFAPERVKSPCGMEYMELSGKQLSGYEDQLLSENRQTLSPEKMMIQAQTREHTRK